MDVPNSDPKQWSSAQAYGLSLICLIVGIVFGCLVHAPGSVKVPATTAKTTAPATTTQVTPEQIKSMTDKAAQPLLEKLSQNPTDTDLMAQIAAVYAKGHQFDVAERYFQQAINVKPSADLYTDLASVYHADGAEDKAMENLNHALELDPKCANALFNLGVMKLRIKGDKKGAIALWEKLIKTNPDNPHRTEIEQMIARVKKSS